MKKVMEIMAKQKKKMGKKKKSKSVAEANIKILKSGKIKIKKGQKISLDSYIENSVNNVVCSRSEGIIPKEDVKVESEERKVEIGIGLSSLKRTISLASSMSDGKTFTIAHVINKKDALSIFDFMDDSIVGTLLRTSTLAAVYKRVKKQWVDLNEDDKTNFTNVLYFPNIFIFLDENTGKLTKKPFSINLLLIVEPAVKDMGEGIEEVSKEDAVRRIITDVYDIAIKLKAEHLIVAPFCHKLFMNDAYYTSELWHSLAERQNVIEGIKSIDFAVNDDNLYIIFKKGKKDE